MPPGAQALPKAYRYTGGCHCGNIGLEFQAARAPEAFRPRACDCSFCRKHGAAYISDPRSTLAIRVNEHEELCRYRQGSGSAEFLVCGKCGVLVAVLYAEGGRVYATVNCRAIDGAGGFGADVSVSPQKLATDEKRARWKELWFTDVTIV